MQDTIINYKSNCKDFRFLNLIVLIVKVNMIVNVKNALSLIKSIITNANKIILEAIVNQVFIFY